MILIPPGFDCRGGEGSDGSGLIASIKYALALAPPFDTTNLCFRTLGNGVVIEGMVNAPAGYSRIGPRSGARRLPTFHPITTERNEGDARYHEPGESVTRGLSRSGRAGR